MPAIPRQPAKTVVFESTTDVDCPVERLFAFHRDTRNAPKVSPGTRFLSIDGAFPLNDGDVFTIRFVQWPSPFAVTWTFIVEAVVANKAVVDVALKAPFPYWRHEHRFESLGPDRSRLTDRVTFVPPMGPVGRVGYSLIGRHLIRKLFTTRHERTREVLGTRP